ncbi:hypothetical protein ABZ215_36665 [Amycolatopsis sp. NPDC006131]|uniref:hypothetical protein n=1 Tax=Amycolatopsis sp. NPDC006131 TaxID=3156731 RepID=UPI0033A40FA1
MSEGSAQGPETTAAAAAEEVAKAPTWGQRYTWDDGLAIEVSAPSTCKPSQYAFPQNVQRAVKFKVTITNGTDKPYEAAALGFGTDAQFNSTKAESVFDSGGPCGDGGAMQSATILPGKSFSFEQAYAVGPQPGEMQLAFQPTFGADKAVFLGQA